MVAIEGVKKVERENEEQSTSRLIFPMVEATSVKERRFAVDRRHGIIRRR